MKNSYALVKKFVSKYPYTLAWRLKKHCRVIDDHLSATEEILYAFAGQNNESSLEIFNTYVVALTNKRIVIARKRLLFGYFFKSITPDMYNDLSVNKGLIWGRVILDSVKEVITITNIDAAALPDIDNNINEIMTSQKKEYGINRNENAKK